MKISYAVVGFLEWSNDGQLNKSSKETYRRKLAIFFEYLSTFNITDYDDIIVIKDYINIFHVINSIKYSLENYNINFSTTVKCYGSVVSNFFDYLNEKKILNNTFAIKSKINELNDEIDKYINEIELNKKRNFDALTDDEFIELSEICDYYIHSFNINDNMVQRITESNKHIDEYDKFISSLAIKIVMLTGIKNNVLYSINMDDIDVNNNKLKIGNYLIYLPYKLRASLEKYFILRRKIIISNNRKEEALFINRKAERTTSNSLCFKVLKEVLGNIASKIIAKYTITNMLNQKADIVHISHFTGYSINETILECAKTISNEVDYKNINTAIKGVDVFDII